MQVWVVKVTTQYWDGAATADHTTVDSVWHSEAEAEAEARRRDAETSGWTEVVGPMEVQGGQA